LHLNLLHLLQIAAHEELDESFSHCSLVMQVTCSVSSVMSASYILSATSRAVAALFSYRREYGIKGVHGAEGACCVVQEFGSSRKAGASDPQVDVN